MRTGQSGHFANIPCCTSVPGVGIATGEIVTMKLEIPSFAGASVLVVGDVMLDRYWYGTAGRVSAEAPVPIVDVDVVDEKPGGAANVAVNIAALGARCTLRGRGGRDAAAPA